MSSYKSPKADTSPRTTGRPLRIDMASIETVWAGVVTPPRGHRVQRWQYAPHQYQLARGEELGRFNMGSTVIVLFGSDQVTWRTDLHAKQPVRMGQALGRLRCG
ncbi:MAG: phosphatidylserine decarboxylase [Nitrococcus sp.]|nr:phosphatidylserine decarboxylase [Nitrococcus sp.]